MSGFHSGALALRRTGRNDIGADHKTLNKTFKSASGVSPDGMSLTGGWSLTRLTVKYGRFQRFWSVLSSGAEDNQLHCTGQYCRLELVGTLAPASPMVAAAAGPVFSLPYQLQHVHRLSAVTDRVINPLGKMQPNKNLRSPSWCYSAP